MLKESHLYLQELPLAGSYTYNFKYLRCKWGLDWPHAHFNVSDYLIQKNSFRTLNWKIFRVAHKVNAFLWVLKTPANDQLLHLPHFHLQIKWNSAKSSYGRVGCSKHQWADCLSRVHSSSHFCSPPIFTDNLVKQHCDFTSQLSRAYRSNSYNHHGMLIQCECCWSEMLGMICSKKWTKFILNQSWKVAGWGASSFTSTPGASGSIQTQVDVPLGKIFNVLGFGLSS